MLRLWLKPDLQACLFSPAEAIAARAAQRRQARQTPLSPSHVRHQQQKRKPNPQRTPQDHDSTMTYRRAITYGLTKANAKIDDDDQKFFAWLASEPASAQCGDSAAKKYGIELARIVLGHSTVS